MKFLYKIYSGYDGFTPRRIPERLEEGKLPLSWTRYIDAVENGAECWIYFYGPHAFKPGVYIKGFVSAVEHQHQRVLLKPRECNLDEPLTDPETSDRIAEAVSVRFRQVFVWPEAWDQVPDCSIEACKDRLCENCQTWQGLPLIRSNHLHDPERLSAQIEAYVPAYWIIPSRCYVYSKGGLLKQSVHKATHMFQSFKVGEKRYAYPLARGIYEALRDRELLEFDGIVPIPLSPDKQAAGEEHRTRHLARELSRLLGAPVQELLKLQKPVSKRRMLADGYSAAQFEREYFSALAVHGRLPREGTLLLVDDVGTKGSTASQAVKRLREADDSIAIVVGTAGQMIVKAAVRAEVGFIR